MPRVSGSLVVLARELEVVVKAGLKIKDGRLVSPANQRFGPHGDGQPIEMMRRFVW